MARQLLAAIIDVTLAGAAALAGFQITYRSIPCTDVAECAPLAPLVVLGVLLLVGLYFGIGHCLWRTTPGRRLAGVREET